MKWKNSKRQIYTQDQVLEILKKVAQSKNHKIIIGSDSVKLGDRFVFANAICIINDNEFYDRRFFYLKRKVYDDTFYDLSKRLLKETSDSIDIALNIKKLIKNANIEIHADVNSDTSYMSSRYKNMIVGYITGCGFECKTKPESFVASGIADVYTRKAWYFVTYTGKLLRIDKKKFGVKCVLDARQNVINVSVKPGVYLITEEVCNEKEELLFVEILCKSSLVLLNIESIKKLEII